LTGRNVRGERRRTVVRAWGEWMGSTLAGYLAVGDDITYRKNFRVTKQTFNVLLTQLQSKGYLQDGKSTNPLLRVPGRFKLGVCLYFFGQGTGWKAAGDCGSVGESTVRGWVDDFMSGTCDALRPIYMPKEPPSSDMLDSVRSRFASRRGVPNVALAVDGTHIPYRPDDKKTAIDYRNYKGWMSILAVAFVNSYHLFVDARVGAPGRSGDNTVLLDSWLMKAITRDREAWLGTNGVIAADGGASDGSDLLLNPYRSPQTPAECWFNFCHSSTRFYVEETFGRWKNRFRFLLRQGDYDHKTLVRMVYTSMILHNACTIHRDNAVDFNVGSCTEWQLYFDTYAPAMCPTCRRLKKGHCVHEAKNRSKGRGAAVTGAAHAQMDKVKDMLWDEVEGRDIDELVFGEEEEARMHGIQRVF